MQKACVATAAAAVAVLFVFLFMVLPLRSLAAAVWQTWRRRFRLSKPAHLLYRFGQNSEENPLFQEYETTCLLADLGEPGLWRMKRREKENTGEKKRRSIYIGERIRGDGSR